MRKILTMLLFCLAGVFLNVLITRLCFNAGLPLFLDTILTITVTLICGLPWGMLCGAFTNVIYHSIFGYGWEAYLFTLCNIATAVVTWLFMKFFPRELAVYKLDDTQQKLPLFSAKSNFLSALMDRIIILILFSFALCLTMSILGGLIATFIIIINSSYTEVKGITGVLSATMFDHNVPLVVKEIISRIPINIIDRLISVFAGFGIAKLIAAKRVDIGK